MKFFNPKGTWMDNVNPDLLMRLWTHKGEPGVFVCRRWGMEVFCTPTVYGTLSWIDCAMEST